ncbi:hypothetical protein SESBI_51372 [Sesbania bispinosa]|nr:hypothetical protein SESBI_51372 [Sesbania bispinosa]
MGSLRIVIEPTMVHVPFPYDFYQPMQNELGKRIELFDNSDQRLPFYCVLVTSLVMWELAEDLKRVYNFNKTVYMYLNYEGGKTFRFDLRDEESNVTLTPALAYRSGRNGGGDTENQSGLVNASVGSREDLSKEYWHS